MLLFIKQNNFKKPSIQSKKKKDMTEAIANPII